MKQRYGAAIVAAAIVLGAAAPASAQIWIGQIAGEAAGQAAAAAREKACLEGAPPDAKQAAQILAQADALMGAYFNLTSKSSPAALNKVFAMKSAGVSFRDDKGKISPAELGARLDAPTPTLAVTSSVVAGDLQSARVIWTATPPDGGEPKALAVDFLMEMGFWAGGWRIWHMTETSPDQAPSPPGAYCHFDVDQAF